MVRIWRYDQIAGVPQTIIARLIENPIPAPLALVAKKALNSRSAFSMSTAMPESCTITSTSPAVSRFTDEMR